MTGRWRTDKMPGGYVVHDANGQALAYIYARDSEAEAMQAKASRLLSSKPLSKADCPTASASPLFDAPLAWSRRHQMLGFAN